MSDIIPTAPPVWRAVMSDAEYERKREHILETWGASNEEAKIRREQEWAHLFYESGWTHERLAEKEGKSREWMSTRLRLGRFLAVSQNGTICTNLTEGRFRAHWKLTSNLKSDELARFREVERLLVQSEENLRTHTNATGKAYRTRFMNSGWHNTAEIAGTLEKPQSEVINTLDLMVQRGPANVRYRVERRERSHGIIEYRLFQPAKQKAKPIPPSVIPPLAPEEMKPTTRQRYERALALATKQIRGELIAEVTAEVHAEFEIYLKHWRERTSRAERIIAAHQGVMTRRNFRVVLAGLHPDHNKFEQAHSAFKLFQGLESVLVKSEAPSVEGPPLPASVAEMMARRRTKARR